MIRRCSWLLLALLALGVALAPSADAHATVVASDPADGSRLARPPHAVTITFDENVGIGGVAYLHVTDQAGKRVDAGAAFHPGGNGTKVTDTVTAGLGAGAYTASFRVISADSHPVAGTIRFVVGSGALVHGTLAASAVNGETADLFGLVRWASYAGVALLGGAWLLLTVWPAGRDDRRACRLVWAGWGLTAGGALVELLMQGPFSAGSGVGRLLSAALIDQTLHSSYGVLHCIRLLLLGALALVLGRVLQPDVRAGAAPAVAGALALGVVVTFSAAGHPTTTSPAWLSVPVDMAHLLAMGVWLGGLAMLVYAILPRRDGDELGVVLPVFSRAAFASVITLASTGSYAAWRGIGTVHALTTGYALLIAGKVALFFGMLALGNVSRGAVQRGTSRPAEARRTPVAVGSGRAADGDRDGWDGNVGDAGGAGGAGAPHVTDDGFGTANDVERLRRSVTVEVVLGVAVLFLTSVLVARPRGKEALAAAYRRPVEASAALGDGRRVSVVADPGVHGPVDVTVAVSGGARASITATATQKAAQIGPLPVPLTRRGDRTFDGTVNLPVAGGWDVDLVVTTGTFDAVTTDVTLTFH